MSDFGKLTHEFFSLQSLIMYKYVSVMVAFILMVEILQFIHLYLFPINEDKALSLALYVVLATDYKSSGQLYNFL